MLDNFRHKGLRRRMVEYLQTVRGITNQTVLNAILNVPRHLFLDSSFLEFAYEDKPFPIGSDQTISSLYTVAFQTQLLNAQPNERILEIGTGSGYQSAILAQIGAEVYSIERHRNLHIKAKNILSKLNYRVKLFYGDGYLGLDNYAPFDKIIVTCGATEIPEPLLKQLNNGGCIVIPIGFQNQKMTLISRDSSGNDIKKEYENCKFVPLLRDRE